MPRGRPYRIYGVPDTLPLIALERVTRRLVSSKAVCARLGLTRQAIHVQAAIFHPQLRAAERDKKQLLSTFASLLDERDGRR